MALGKLQAAFAAFNNELTVAAANINFDFTLVKIAAPKEYQPLGDFLPSNRKENAEVGSMHVTARKLGALFEELCPSTPMLVKAYGTRVSEIARSTKDLSTKQYANAVFAAQSGIEGTSIWAAATSSTAAIQI
jgi:hypothetical protein